MTDITEIDALIEALEEGLESDDLFFSYNDSSKAKGKKMILNKLKQLREEKASQKKN